MEHPLADADFFLLGDHGQNRNHSLAENAGRIEILLSERAPSHAIAGQPLQMLKGLESAFA
jgi:hypothetical protein